MPTIATEAELAAFRTDWSGELVLDRLKQCGGKGLIAWPVGVGKSWNLDAVIEAAVGRGYDLVVCFQPTRAVTAERQWIKTPPPGLRVVDLKARPAADCGRGRDEQWKDMEQRGLGLLARAQICGGCPRRQSCTWPDQYGKFLQGTRVLFARHAQLERDPEFLRNVKRWTNASRVLVILDEDTATLTSYRREVTRADLDRLAAVLKHLRDRKKIFETWESMCRALLVQIDRTDLRCHDWKFPPLTAEEAVILQRMGVQIFPDAFRDVHHTLRTFTSSSFASRDLTGLGGSVRFAAGLRIDDHDHLLVYSGTSIAEFLNYRLGVKLENLCGGFAFWHQCTRWFNIASRLGAARYFRKNADTILDFFAGLVAQRIREGRRPLLVSKKAFAPMCAEGVQRRLRALGLRKARVVSNKWSARDLTNPNVVPLITYGLIGTNLFEDFDAAYCLNSFYVPKEVIDSVVQDVLATDLALDLEVVMNGKPLRRSVLVADPRHRGADVQELAGYALRAKEMDMVLQAVGRVRPFTKAREVITFQASDHPLVRFDAEFTSLAEARGHFGVQSQRQLATAETRQRVQEQKGKGHSQSETAKVLQLSDRTVMRHWG